MILLGVSLRAFANAVLVIHRATKGAAHVAFTAPSRAAVDLFHQYALRAGAASHGTPHSRDPSGEYYSAAVLDFDGNAVEAVYRGSPESYEKSMARDARPAGGNRVLNWQKDVARSLSEGSERLEAQRSVQKAEQAASVSGRSNITITAEESAQKASSLLTSKALVTTLLGAAAGAAVAYAMAKSEQPEALSQPRASSTRRSVSYTKPASPTPPSTSRARRYSNESSRIAPPLVVIREIEEYQHSSADQNTQSSRTRYLEAPPQSEYIPFSHAESESQFSRSLPIRLIEASPSQSPPPSSQASATPRGKKSAYVSSVSPSQATSRRTTPSHASSRRAASKAPPPAPEPPGVPQEPSTNYAYNLPLPRSSGSTIAPSLAPERSSRSSHSHRSHHSHRKPILPDDDDDGSLAPCDSISVVGLTERQPSEVSRKSHRSRASRRDRAQEDERPSAIPESIVAESVYPGDSISQVSAKTTRLKRSDRSDVTIRASDQPKKSHRSRVSAATLPLLRVNSDSAVPSRPHGSRSVATSYSLRPGPRGPGGDAERDDMRQYIVNLRPMSLAAGSRFNPQEE
ncbi:MAG: hypothetical protein M1829_006742 [Trizodia sp. TS-e1964]|nr:MAG: hypothetical protein M1829_006742 [Trizodia sp. TS-e1964]